MLTINQVNKIYQEGFDIRVTRAHHPGFKGEIDPSTLEIFIYQSNVESQYDKDITILHEFLHAKDELKSNLSSTRCSNIDKQAVWIYNNKPHVLQYIKDLYNIR